MKVYQLLEEHRPLLLDLIDQRIGKGETVRLDFWAEKNGAASAFISGKVSETRGLSAYFISPHRGNSRYTFGPDADSAFNLVKRDDGWKVQRA